MSEERKSNDSWNIRVVQFDEQKALSELKSCPKIVRDYVKLIKGHWDNQKDIANKAITQLKKYATENSSKDQQIKELESLLEHASIVIDLKTDNKTFKDLLSDYQQKYPKQ